MKRQVVDLSTNEIRLIDLTAQEVTQRASEEQAYLTRRDAATAEKLKTDLRRAAIDAIQDELLTARIKDADAPQAVKDYAATL
jgi:hypothetical protein